MPKLNKAVCRNATSYKSSILNLLSTIAKRHNKKRGDVVIAFEQDISVYAVRRWITSPIPKKHMQAISDLSGISIDSLESLNEDNFEMVSVGKL